MDPATSAFLRLSAPHPLLEWAQAELVQRCASAAGFPDFPRGAASSCRLTLQRFPAVRTQGLVGRLGFGSEISRDDHTDLFERHRQALPEARRHLLDLALDDPDSPSVEVSIPGLGRAGASTRGCYARMRTLLYGDVAGFLRVSLLPQGANSHIRGLATDDGIVRANQLYVRCMAGQGYTLTAWTETALLAQSLYSPTDGMATTGARERELALAEADRQCLKAAGLPEAYEAAVIRMAHGWIQQNGDALLETDATLTEAVRRAAAVRSASPAAPRPASPS
jgi:hypothetical protein